MNVEGIKITNNGSHIKGKASHKIVSDGMWEIKDISK
jgi:hypothetical protein